LMNRLHASTSISGLRLFRTSQHVFSFRWKPLQNCLVVTRA